MATPKKAAAKKKPAKKAVETRGRKKSVLTKQVWFRVSDKEKQLLLDEADEQGRMLAGHVRRIFLKGWEVIHEQQQDE